MTWSTPSLRCVVFCCLFLSFATFTAERLIHLHSFPLGIHQTRLPPSPQPPESTPIFKLAPLPKNLPSTFSSLPHFPPYSHLTQTSIPNFIADSTTPNPKKRKRNPKKGLGKDKPTTQTPLPFKCQCQSPPPQNGKRKSPPPSLPVSSPPRKRLHPSHLLPPPPSPSPPPFALPPRFDFFNCRFEIKKPKYCRFEKKNRRFDFHICRFEIKNRSTVGLK